MVLKKMARKTAPADKSGQHVQIVGVKCIPNKESNQLQMKRCSEARGSPTRVPLQLFSPPWPIAHPHTSPHCHILTPTHALIWPLEKAVTVSGPLPWEDKLPVKTTTFSGIHIRGKTKEVLRSWGITLKLFIVCFLLPSPLCLSPTLFCQLTTRATVSLHPILNFGYRM